MRNSPKHRLAALEAAQRATAPVLMLPIAIVELGDDGEVLRVVREVPARPPVPFDYVAVVGELWGEESQKSNASMPKLRTRMRSF